LSPEEIVAIRSSLGVTQELFEDVLAFGRKTVVRWESGAVNQGHAADTVLRALRGNPTVFYRLAAERGIALTRVSESQTPWQVVGNYAFLCKVGATLIGLAANSVLNVSDTIGTNISFGMNLSFTRPNVPTGASNVTSVQTLPPSVLATLGPPIDLARLPAPIDKAPAHSAASNNNLALAA
jgi:hypothetical protein